MAVSVTEIAPRGEGFDRTPPHDVAAEQCVLGGMLLSKDAISDVMETIRPDDHYRPAHQIVHEAILELYGRGEPADPVTVSDLLNKRGELARVGGPSYLHTLIASVPTAANAGYYARIVRERAILRRLVEVGTRIVQLGYSGDGEADELVDRAQAEVYGVTERRVSEDYLSLSEIMPAALDEIEAIGSRGGGMTGVPTGFADLDALTNGLHPGQMVVIAARPAVGKSTLALDLARAAAIKHSMPTVMFSLEMSRNEITMRLLSAEARVPLHSMRTGQMGEEDWTRLARRMSEVVDAPLFIDDSPNMSMMEIRAKCRRLKQRNDLKVVIVDYLQLMSSPKRVENRQQEVSDMSRSLKLLAKEIDVPVIAISQLNRGPEQRTDKKPLLSDLRESGCLIADTRILRADTGAEVTLGELVASGEQDVPVWSLDDRLRLVPTTMTRAFPSGTKEVFRVRLRSGREVRATANHPFLTYDGWRPLGALGPGSRVGVARHTPGPVNLRSLPAEDVILLARQLGDGSPEQAIPDSIWSVPRSQLALFLRHLWGANGCIWWDARAEQSRIYYPSASRRLIDDIARLLLRFNVMAQIFALGRDSQSPRYLLVVDGTEDQLRFLDGIGIPGAGGPIAKATRERLRSARHDGATARVPGDVWERVGRVLEMRQSAFCGDASAGKVWRSAAPHSLVPGQLSLARGDGQAKPAQEQLSRVATILDDAELDMVATNDIFWDEIAAVESLGQQPVYDATVPGRHNFVANGISLHNSIEQDSDVVILLHREDAYERESPRAGEADLIVAKHRNGPTATVTVAFQGHYSRFVDMAPG
jgi:replicative DNA helicase